MSKTATAKAKRPKVTWLGNKSTNELHRVVEGEEHPEQCHLELMNEENTEAFRIAADALKNSRRKWDAAKWCNRRFKSRENT